MSRTISARPDRVFDMWTQPEELKQWWGLADVRCISVELDIRVGGAYRICNDLPDGTVVWISGLFRRIERPALLEHGWSVAPGSNAPELVTVKFAAHENGTMLILLHRRITSEALRDDHRKGWTGCLDGLVRLARRMATGAEG